jgi:hypothetical protein
MKSHKDQFLELLNDARDIFSEDNVTMEPTDVDRIISKSDNDMFDVIESDINQDLREKVRIIEQTKRKRLFADRKQQLQILAEKHKEELRSDLNVSDDEFIRKVEDMKSLKTGLINEIREALEDEL